MRPLPYPLDYELGTAADTPVEPPVTFQSLEDWPTDDPDERIRVVFDLSLNEYVALASSVDVGRDIAYGDNSMYVWWIWCRMVASLSICEDMIICIENDIGVQNALAGFLNANSLNGNENLADRYPGYDTDTIATLDGACDLDELWGGILEIVTRLDDFGREFLEDLANINDQVERIQGVIDLVPILGDFVSDVADFFTESVPDLLTAYNAFSNQSSLEQVACNIFSAVCEECRYPTFDEVYAQFIPLANAGFPSFALATMKVTWDVVRSVTSIAPETVWYTINAFQMFVLGLDATFFGNTGRKSIRLWASLGEDFPSDNWLALCGDCTSNCLGYDFTIGQQDWNPVLQNTGANPPILALAIYDAGEGWTSQGQTAGAVNPRNAIRIYNDEVALVAETMSIEIESTVDRTIGIFVYTVDEPSQTFTQIFSQEGYNLLTGTNQFTVNLPAYTPEDGYRVDVRASDGELRVVAHITAIEFCD